MAVFKKIEVAKHSQSVVGQAAEGRSKGLVGFFHNPFVFWNAAFASLGCIMYGYDQGVMSSILVMENFEAHFPTITGPAGATLQSMVVAILELGAWLGALVAGFFCDMISRKYTIHVAVLIFTLGTGLQIGAQNVGFLLSGRFFGGFGLGMFAMVIPLYQSEIAPPELRGSLVSLFQQSITIGSLFAFWIDFGMHFVHSSNCLPEGQPDNYDHWVTYANGTRHHILFNWNEAHGHTCTGEIAAAWRVPLALQLIPCWVLFFGMFFFPFSPRWLVMKERDEEAKKALSRLRRLDTDDPLLIAEYLDIKAAVMFDAEVAGEAGSQGLFSPWLEMFTPNIFKRLSIGVWVMIFQQFTGINAVMYYAPQLFADFGFTSVTTELLATGVTGILQVLFTTPAVLFLDKFGRKSFMISGAIWMAVCFFILAGIDATYESNWAKESGLDKGQGWAAVVFMWLFCVGFAYSWGPCAWVVCNEIFPASFRARGVAICTSTNWLMNFVIGISTKHMVAHMKYGTYIFFALFCVLAALFFIFIVPETKDKTLEELDVYFGGTEESIAAIDRERMRRIQEQLGMFANNDLVIHEKTRIVEHGEDS